MAQDRVSKTILQYTVDQASINKALQSADRVEGRIKTLAATADKTTSRTGSMLGKIETVTQQLSRSLSGLGLGGAGQALGGVSDILQIKNATADAAEGSKLLSTGLIALTAVSAATAGAIQIMNQNLEPTAKLLTQATSQLDAYYEAIATGTTESIQKQLDSLRAQKQAIETEAAQMQAAFDKAFKSEQQGFGGDAVARLKFALAEANPEFKKTEERLAALKQQSLDLAGKIGGLETAQKSGAVTTNDAAAAEKELMRARLAGIDVAIKDEVERQRLMRSATPEQVADLINERQAEANAIKDQMDQLRDKANVDKDAAAKYGELEQAYLKDIQYITWYKDVLLGLAQGHKAAADAAKKSVDAVQAQADYISKQNATIADAVKGYNADVKALEAESLQERAAIQQRYNDKIVDLARTAADEAAQALTKLEEQRADLLTGVNRDLEKAERDRLASELDTRLSAAREDEKAARDHYQELQRIRQDAADREFDMILNRDFLALFQSRRQTTQDLLRANADYQTGRSERQIATQQQVADIRRQAATERSERLIAYQQQLTDASAAYNREIQQSQAKHQAQLQLAYQAYQQELSTLATETANKRALLRQRSIDEINMARMTYDARIKYLQAERDMLLKQAYSMTASAPRATTGGSGSSGSGSGSVYRTVRTAAGGAMLDPGMLSVVHGGETFPGLGLFYALQGGAVTNNINSNFNISGNNSEALWRAMEPKIAQTVLRLIS